MMNRVQQLACRVLTPLVVRFTQRGAKVRMDRTTIREIKLN